jgi:hypothetical protein
MDGVSVPGFEPESREGSKANPKTKPEKRRLKDV